MSHESSTGLPRADSAPQPWERAEPLVWREFRLHASQLREFAVALKAVGDNLRTIERALGELKPATTTAGGVAASAQSGLGDLAKRVEALERERVAREAVEEAEEAAEVRAVRRDWGALTRRLLGLLAGAGGGAGLYHWLG